MSEFLMIVPEGWTEVDANWIIDSGSYEEVSNWVQQEDWQSLANGLAAADLAVSGVVNARLFNDGTRLRLWIMVT